MDDLFSAEAEELSLFIPAGRQPRRQTHQCLGGELRRFSLLPALLASAAESSEIDPKQTFVLQRDGIRFAPWAGLPPGSGEMAKLYGDIDRPGPYLVLMKWNPGWFSAPHSYAMSGTWWVNSGADFTPDMAVPVPAGGYVKRTARTFHYDGVPHGTKEPVVIALFGIGPVDIRLADPHLPAWRQV